MLGPGRLQDCRARRRRQHGRPARTDRNLRGESSGCNHPAGSYRLPG